MRFAKDNPAFRRYRADAAVCYNCFKEPPSSLAMLRRSAGITRLSVSPVTVPAATARNSSQGE